MQLCLEPGDVAIRPALRRSVMPGCERRDSTSDGGHVPMSRPVVTPYEASCLRVSADSTCMCASMKPGRRISFLQSMVCASLMSGLSLDTKRPFEM